MAYAGKVGAPRARDPHRASMHSFEAAQPSANLHKPHRCSIRAITSSAPALDSGSLRLPHFGDCTHDGQPDSHGHSPISRCASPTSALEAAEALPRDPDAAGVAVVDEDRRAARSAGGRSSTGRRCPSGRTSPAAAAPRSARARRRAASRAGRSSGKLARAGRRRSSYQSACVVNVVSAAGRAPGGRSPRGRAGACAGRRAPARSPSRVPKRQRHAERLAAVEQPLDLGVGLVLGLRVPVAVEGLDERAARRRGRARATS